MKEPKNNVKSEKEILEKGLNKLIYDFCLKTGLYEIEVFSKTDIFEDDELQFQRVTGITTKITINI